MERLTKEQAAAMVEADYIKAVEAMYVALHALAGVRDTIQLIDSSGGERYAYAELLVLAFAKGRERLYERNAELLAEELKSRMDAAPRYTTYLEAFEALLGGENNKTDGGSQNI